MDGWMDGWIVCLFALDDTTRFGGKYVSMYVSLFGLQVLALVKQCSSLLD